MQYESEVTDEEVEKAMDIFKKGRGEGQTELNDSFAKGLGFPSLEEFKTALKRQLALDKDRNNQMDVENQIVEDLIKNAKLMVPQSLVMNNLERRLHELLNRLKSSGSKEEDLKKKEEEYRKALLPVVEKEVRVYLILEEIARLENIASSNPNESVPGKVMEFLLKEANWKDV
ncbi:MAG: hypothetical protein HQL13_03760 [Candidatus Omnitrophica bacterium]|nr:hypothetical protein [Candidatus Omnitrophota bacterium]